MAVKDKLEALPYASDPQCAEPGLMEQWRAAFEANPAMYFIVDPAGAITSVNSFGAQQLGYATSELIGQPILDVFHESDRAFVQEEARSCFSNVGHTRRWEARKVRKDGTVLWVRETANAVMLPDGPVLLVACEDVTERKRAEEALRQREKELRDVIESVPAMVFVTDADGRNAVANRRWCEYTGLGPEGVSSKAAIHPDDASRNRAARQRSIAAGEPFEQEVRLRRLDGEYRWFLGRAVPLRDDAGKVLKWYGVHTDIHDRKLAEEVRASHLWFLESLDLINRAMQGTNDLERMMSDVLDAVLEVFACDRAWLIYPCDPDAPSWRAVMEHTRPQFPGAFALGAEVPVIPETADTVRKACAANGAILLGPSHELPVRGPLSGYYASRSRMAMAVRPKVDRAYLFGLHQCSHARVWSDEERRLFEEIGHRLDGALTSLLIFRSLRESVAELRRAQEELSASEQLTRHVFEGAPDGMVVVGRDYRYQRINPVYERDWNMTAEQIVGLHVTDLHGVRAFEQIFKPRLDRCFAGEQVSFAEWFTNLSGRRFYHSVIYTPLRLGSDRVEAVLAIRRDLTDQMLASEALRDAEAALARVNRVTTLGVLAASVAHEVNQPLGAMVTSAAAATRWLAAEPPEMEKARSALQRIARDGSRAGQVVDRIRALVNRQAPRRTRVDVNEAILEVIALTRAEVRRNSIELETLLGADVPPVEGDRVQLQQVVLNLIVNAIEAMSDAGAGTRRLVIRSACEDCGSVTVEVLDSGPGVAQGSVDRLFEAFYTTKEQGIGMGLSISRSIVEAHGGRLWVTCNTPHGAAFHLSLPGMQPVT
ncbi:MAG: PAS domain S-box protein [Pseudomonadota bacterium]